MIELMSLLVTAGPQSGRRIEVTGELVIGRHDVAFEIDDPQISRRHAVLRLGHDRLEIEDLGSRNGTWVNDRRIDSAKRLAPGDVIRIGTSSLEVVGVDATVAAPAPELPQANVAAVAPPLVPPLPPPAAAAPPAPAAPATTPTFGAFSPPSAPRRRVAATRQLVPMLLAFGTVVATSVALIVYFAAR